MLDRVTKPMGLLAAAALIGSVSTTSQADLLAYYSFDNVSNLGADSSGNGYDLTALGAPSAVAGQVNGAVSFDGVDDKFQHAPASDIYPNTQNISISLWVKADSVSGLQNISRMAATNGSNPAGGINVYVDGGTYRVNPNYNGSPATNSGVSAVAGQWAHIAYTFQGDGNPPAATTNVISGISKIYINGTLAATVNASGYDTDGGGTFALGGRATNATFFGGDVDEYASYDQVLTDQQIAGLANGTLTPLTAVPEPGSLTLAGLGALALCARRRKA